LGITIDSVSSSSIHIGSMLSILQFLRRNIIKIEASPLNPSHGGRVHLGLSMEHSSLQWYMRDDLEMVTRCHPPTPCSDPCMCRNKTRYPTPIAIPRKTRTPWQCDISANHDSLYESITNTEDRWKQLSNFQIESG